MMLWSQMRFSNVLKSSFILDFEKQDQVMNMELPKYKGKEGDFRRMLAAKGCLQNSSSYDPGTLFCLIFV